MTFEEWRELYDPEGMVSVSEEVRAAWDASREQIVSQRECYQRGYASHKRQVLSTIDQCIESTKAAIPNDDPDFDYRFSDQAITIIALELLKERI